MSQLSSVSSGGGGGAGTVTSVSGGNNITITGVPTVNPTVNVSGTTNFAVQIGNATGSLTSVALGGAGQVLTSNGAGVAPTFQAAAGGGITTIAGDTGSTTGPVVTFDGNANAGASVLFIVTGTTVSLDVTDTADNVFIGQNSGAALGAGTTQGNTALGSGTLQAINVNANPGANTCIGYVAGNGIVLGTANTFVGYNAAGIVEGDNNTFIGNQAGSFGDDDLDGNTCVGSFAGAALVATSVNNVSLGFNALVGGGPIGATIPTNNVAIGTDALNISLGAPVDNIGSYNIAIGSSVGSLFTGGEDSNIYLNHLGVPADSNTLRIGAGAGAGNQQLNRAFIHGIFGITVGVSGIPVVVDNTGQLGTIVSSKRYKDNIVDMAPTNVLSLRPVNFTYKSDKYSKMQYGLIAEEVEEVMPDLVCYNQEGLPESVKYQDLSVLLLKEIQKLKADVEELKARV